MLPERRKTTSSGAKKLLHCRGVCSPSDRRYYREYLNGDLHPWTENGKARVLSRRASKTKGVNLLALTNPRPPHGNLQSPARRKSFVAAGLAVRLTAKLPRKYPRKKYSAPENKKRKHSACATIWESHLKSKKRTMASRTFEKSDRGVCSTKEQEALYLAHRAALS